MHDITIGRSGAGIRMRFSIDNQPSFSCASCRSHFYFTQSIKLYSKIIYAFSTIQRLILNLKKYSQKLGDY